MGEKQIIPTGSVPELRRSVGRKKSERNPMSE